MRQVHPGAGLGEHVGGPVPAVGGLEHHLRLDTGLSDLASQRQRVVHDPPGLQVLAGLGLAHDHRPSPVQINPDELPAVILIHQGPPSTSGLRSPSIARDHEEREAPLLHHIKGTRQTRANRADRAAERIALLTLAKFGSGFSR